jgi:WD40 repeat protein
LNPSTELWDTDWSDYLTMFDLQTGNTIARMTGFPRLGLALAFAPDDSRLALVVLPGLFGGEVRVQVYDILRKKEVQLEKRIEFQVGSPIRSLAFSPDGTSLLTGSDDGGVRLWILAPVSLKREFKGHQGPVDQLAFAGPEGQRIVSASRSDRTLRVWNNADKVGPVVEKEANKIVLARTESPMTCAALGPANRALTGHTDGSVVVWDLATGKELERFARVDASITAVALSPDANQGLAALSDHSVVLYRLLPTRGNP